jgi:hypothetical protein
MVLEIKARRSPVESRQEVEGGRWPKWEKPAATKQAGDTRQETFVFLEATVMCQMAGIFCFLLIDSYWAHFLVGIIIFHLLLFCLIQSLKCIIRGFFSVLLFFGCGSVPVRDNNTYWVQSLWERTICNYWHMSRKNNAWQTFFVQDEKWRWCWRPRRSFFLLIITEFSTFHTAWISESDEANKKNPRIWSSEHKKPLIILWSATFPKLNHIFLLFVQDDMIIISVKPHPSL